MITVKIMFTTKPGIFSWMVRKVLGTKYSHVILDIYLPDVDRNVAYESGAFGINQLNDFDVKKNVLIHSRSLSVTKEQGTKLRQFCIDNLHRKYGYLTMIGLFFKMCLGIKTKLGNDGNQTFICSEFVIKALKALNIDFKTTFNKDLDPIVLS